MLDNSNSIGGRSHSRPGSATRSPSRPDSAAFLRRVSDDIEGRNLRLASEECVFGADDVVALCTHIGKAFEPAATQAASIAADVTSQVQPRLHRVAALLRTQLFIQRYTEDIANRPDRVKDVAKQWCPSALLPLFISHCTCSNQAGTQ